MHVRKLIAFGKSTFSITLPKKWVVKNSLKKGDTLFLKEMSMGRLEISPLSREEQPISSISLKIDGKPLKEIQREFIAAYINGYSVINLIGNHEGKVSDIRRKLHELIAVEVMEVSSNRITANVFFDISTISLSNIISRIGVITKTIFDDMQSMVDNEKKSSLRYKELIQKKHEIDRQSLFATRIIVAALKDPIFGAKIDADPLKLSFIWHLIEHMEKISDFLVTTAFYITSTDVLKKLQKKGKEDLVHILILLSKNYDNAIHSYNKNNISLANHVFDSHFNTEKFINSFLAKYLSRWIPAIAGYLRRVSSKTREISRVTIYLNIK